MVAVTLPTTTERHALVDMIAETLPGARPASWRLLGDRARIRSHPKGATIMPAGEPLHTGVLLEGFAGFRRTTATGLQVLVGTAAPGHLFGISGMSSQRASVDVVAFTECRLASWPGSTLRRLAADDPGLALDLIDRLSISLAIMTEKVDGFLHQDARTRVMRVLSRNQQLFFGEHAVLSRTHLPALVGTTREQTGRVLRELEQDGTVERVGRSGLRLLRPDLLEPDPLPKLAGST
jgi:CRP-like cAMP-binding protein